MAAKHLRTGRAVGVDVWNRKDQSGNSAEATRRNAIAEEVSDQVELHTADMTALPFKDDCFDVVVSSMAIHNVKGADRRDRAIDEVVRSPPPGRPRADRRHLGHRTIPSPAVSSRYDGSRPPRFGLADVVERPLAADPPRYRHQADRQVKSCAG